MTCRVSRGGATGAMPTIRGEDRRPAKGHLLRSTRPWRVWRSNRREELFGHLGPTQSAAAPASVDTAAELAARACYDRLLRRVRGHLPSPRGRASRTTPEAVARERRWRRTPVGVMATLAGVGILTATLRALSLPQHPQAYTFIYLAVVVIAASIYGFPAALAGSVASALLVDYFFLPPVGRLTIYSTAQAVGWAVFLLVCLGVAALTTARRRHLLQLRAATAQLEASNAELQAAESELEKSVAARTELARTEAALAATRRAETFRRELLATVSHELRTPLSALLGYSSALVEAGAEDAGRWRDYPRLIAAEARRMDRLIDDLLEMARIETGQVHIETQVMDLGDAAQEAAQRWSAALSVEVNAPGDPTLVIADWQRVQQVLDNALRNVQLHSGQDRVELEVTDAPAYRRTSAELVVRDHGVGIAPEVRDRLFQRYAASPAGQGLGLGLAVSRGLAEAMGGALWLDQPAESGVQLHLMLPRAPRPIRGEALNALTISG